MTMADDRLFNTFLTLKLILNNRLVLNDQQTSLFILKMKLLSLIIFFGFMCYNKIK